MSDPVHRPARGHPRSPLSPDAVGARVSVRRRVGGRLADVVGDLESVDADGLAIRRGDGSLVEVATTDIAAARTVAPSLRTAIELEAVSARSWRGSEEAWLGRWWLLSGGLTARANSVRPLGDPGVPFDDALGYVHAWYGERDRPATVRSVNGSSVDAELDRRGWTAGRRAVMQTATVATIRRRLVDTPAGSAVQLSPHPTSSWVGRLHDGTVPPAAVAMLAGSPQAVFATVEGVDLDAPAVAIGRASVEGPWVGFAAIEVDPRHRRLGHARAVMSALVDWAAAQGALRAWLEVLAENTGAVALYSSLGFEEHHRYSYRQPS